MKTPAERYREQARVSRVLAGRVRDKTVKAHLFSVADQYEKLAAKEDQTP